MHMPLIQHNYFHIDGWFDMEKQYDMLLDFVPKGGTIVELGAFKGKSTSYMATEIINRHLSVNFFTVDTFDLVSELSTRSEIDYYEKFKYSDILGDFHFNTQHLRNFFKLIISKSDFAANEFDDKSVDAIFIDAGHSFESVNRDILAWLPKMKEKSIMAGHDYHSFDGVKQAVDSFFKDVIIENNCWIVKNPK